MGQSNVWYAESAYAQRDEAIAGIREYEKLNTGYGEDIVNNLKELLGIK